MAESEPNSTPLKIEPVEDDIKVESPMQTELESKPDSETETEPETEGTATEAATEAATEGGETNGRKTSGDDTETWSTDAPRETGEKSWDTTARKIIVHNILKFQRPKEMDSMVEEWLSTLEDPTTIQVVKVKKPPKANWAHITLAHEDMVAPFLTLVNGKKTFNRRGKPIYAARSSGGGRSETSSGGNSAKRKDREDDEKQGPASKKPRSSTPKTPDEVRDAITPLWKMTYEEQLKRKWKEMVKKCAMKICQELKAKFRTLDKEARRSDKNRTKVEVYDWLKRKRAIEVETIVPSPRRYQYRNKCEFTFGYRSEPIKHSNDGADNNEGQQIKKVPAVGFMASGWSGEVSSPHLCQNTPSEACGVGDLVNEFLASSPIPPYETLNHRGVWRMLTIRLSRRTKECMVTIQHAPPAGAAGARSDGEDNYAESFESEKKRLVEILTKGDIPIPRRRFPAAPAAWEGAASVEEKMFTNSAVSSGKSIEVEKKQAADAGEEHLPVEDKPDEEQNNPTIPIRVTSIFFQEYEGLSMPKPEHPVQHVFGKKCLSERLGNCIFQISPGAFFQVNTECAERLYNIAIEKIREVTTGKSHTLLFDVCCGTGTIGICCMSEGVVERVVGVDISEPAIEDAKANAISNGFVGKGTGEETTRFIASRAETVLGQELARNKGKDCTILAIVDPAREGLHPDVIRAIRVNRRITRLVYISCNPTGTLVRDAALLCAPPTKKYPSNPFKPTQAIPVDMFPLTSHCEMVMTFDRMSSDQ